MKPFLHFTQGFVSVKDSGCHIRMEDLKVPMFLTQNQYIAFGYEYWCVGMTLQGIQATVQGISGKKLAGSSEFLSWASVLPEA